ncbi:MAG: PP2C family protein-serine/threonine phosphatase [Suipraeoptans sp.]
MNYRISAATDIGIVKTTNQDSFNVKVFDTKIGKIVFAILCDGMGGLEKGEVASSTVVNAYMEWSYTRLPLLCEEGITDSAIRNEWSMIANDCNEKIKNYGNNLAIRLGTTLTAILVTDNRYYIINIGDTRVYEVAAEMSILTRDQTVVAREVEEGILTEEEAKTDSRRSVLLQCVGASDNVYPDMYFGNAKKTLHFCFVVMALGMKFLMRKFITI